MTYSDFQIIEETFNGKTQYFDYCQSTSQKRRISKRTASLELPKMEVQVDMGHTKVWVYKTEDKESL